MQHRLYFVFKSSQWCFIYVVLNLPPANAHRTTLRSNNPIKRQLGTQTPPFSQCKNSVHYNAEIILQRNQKPNEVYCTKVYINKCQTLTIVSPFSEYMRMYSYIIQYGFGEYSTSIPGITLFCAFPSIKGTEYCL